MAAAENRSRSKKALFNSTGGWIHTCKIRINWRQRNTKNGFEYTPLLLTAASENGCGAHCPLTFNDERRVLIIQFLILQPPALLQEVQLTEQRTEHSVQVHRHQIREILRRKKNTDCPHTLEGC